MGVARLKGSREETEGPRRGEADGVNRTLGEDSSILLLKDSTRLGGKGHVGDERGAVPAAASGGQSAVVAGQ